MPLSRADVTWIEQQARESGFDLAGIAAVPEPANDDRFRAWVAAGHAGEMDYLQRTDAAGELLRGDLRRSMPWARSVLVCALNYNSDAPSSLEPHDPGDAWIARYAWSGDPVTGQASDYHDVLLRKLRTVERLLRQRFGACETRCYVDTGPVLERDYAVRAGLGWIGRNTCLIHQKQGSWLLLGVVVTSLEVVAQSASLAAADRCGTCTRCIDACPTDALLASPEDDQRLMDAARCIAYLTIEKSGSIAEELRAPMGRQVFGCDICQEVCPWNRRAPITAESPVSPRRELVNPALEWLASLEGTAFARVFRGSPVERTRRQTSRRKFFRRNVAIAMGNSGERRFLPRLDAWAADAEPTLAEAAAWAAARLRGAASTETATVD